MSMMGTWSALGLLMANVNMFPPAKTGEPGKPAAHAPALQFKMNDIEGNEQDLLQYEGKVVMIVNVASQCGLTPQYKGLQKLYDKYKDKGLVILGFPANEFGQQEPGTNDEIKQFCTKKYSVTFPMFEKVCVKGKKICDLYKYLTSKKSGHKFGGSIKWNFNKFLVSRKGEVIGRFEPPIKPEDPKLVSAIEKALADSADTPKKSKSGDKSDD